MAEPSRIDAHAHLAPRSFLKEVATSRAFAAQVEEAGGGYALQFPDLPRIRPATGGLIDAEARRPWMESNAVADQYFGIWLDIQGYTLPQDQIAPWSRLLNEHLARAAEEGGREFHSLASVPVQDGEAAAKELEYGVKTLGMSGVMIPSDPMDQDVAVPAMEPFWTAAEALNVPVLLHGATHSRWNTVAPSYLAFSLGRPFDTTVLAAKLILNGLLDRHPRLKLMLCHGGGFLPYQVHRMQEGYRRGTDKTMELERGGPEAYLPLLYYDTVTLSGPALDLLLRIATADHVMLGSDYVWEPMAGPFMDAVEAAGLTGAQLEAVSRGAAERMFNAAKI